MKPRILLLLASTVAHVASLRGASAGEELAALSPEIPTAALAAPAVAEAAPSTWPQWRGPERDGISRDPRPWPPNLSPAHLTLAWRVAMGPSYSGPIVAEDRVFTTETVDERTEIVRALDRKTGAEIWRKGWEGALKVPFFARDNGSWIRSTPAYDGETLYVAGIRDVLVALDAKTGAERWRVDFPERVDSPTPTFGYVSSPLVVGEHLYTQAGGSFVKLDKRTGAILWRTLEDGGGMYGSAFSSPVLATLGGRDTLLVQTRENLAAVNPETGEVFWSRKVPAFRGMNILTPIVFEEGIFTSNYQGKSYLFRPQGGTGESPATVEPAWTHKAMGYMSTPVVVDGHAYMHLQNRRVSCLDLRTGEEKWRTSERFGEYWSMIAQGDRILALDEAGELILMKADPTAFEILDRREIADSPTWAHLASAGEELHVRELNALAAYVWK